jgi:hypothetical protein
MRARRRARLIVAGLAVLLMGAGAGFALGGFAIRETRPSMADSALASTDMEGADPGDAPAPAVAKGPDRPDRYICHGCGPSLAERNAQSYAAHYAATDPGYDAAHDLAKDYSPLPAYQPMPYEGDEPAERPAIDHE